MNLGENGVHAVPLAIVKQVQEVLLFNQRKDAQGNVLENLNWNVMGKELKLKIVEIYQNAMVLSVSGLNGVLVRLLVAKVSNEEPGDVLDLKNVLVKYSIMSHAM